MIDAINQDGSFRFWIPATVEKSSDGKMWVSGIASTEDEDLQGEKIKQEGLDLSYFLARGFLNDDHSKETGGKVGIPTEARITKKGFWVKGYLLETPRAKAIWDLANALHKAGNDRKLGYSVEGKVLQRDPRNPKIITKAWIKDVAITASPINPNSFLDIAKSFAGHDLTQVLVDGEDQDVTKSEKQEKVVSQTAEELKDAEKTAQEALSVNNDGEAKKPDLEKELKDVPIAKRTRAFKSITLNDDVRVEINDEGHIIIKGVSKETLLKLPKEEVGIVEDSCGECGKKGDCEHQTDTPIKLNINQGEQKEEKTVKQWRKSLNANHEKDSDCTVDSKTSLCTGCGVHHGNACGTCGGKGYHTVKCDAPATSFTEGGPARKSVDTDLEKSEKGSFKKVHEVGGEREAGDKKIPVHVSQYEHPTGHVIVVVGNGDAFSVTHAHKGKDGKALNVGGHLFHTDPAKGKKAKEDCDEHLKGFGITHKFCDKNALLGKALIVAQDDTNCCEICGNTVPLGESYMIKGGYVFDNLDCITKALVAGYQFGVTDQEGGSALRVESLEGSQHDTSYGGHLAVKVKEVKFDTAKANGGKTSVTLKDAIEFLQSRGLPENMADRILVLLVKNDGDISKIANRK